MSRTRLLRPEFFAAPLRIPRPVTPELLEFRERTHPERQVEESVHRFLRAIEAPYECVVIRQYRGWGRPGSIRPALIPDFLIVEGIWEHVTVVEVKAIPGNPAAVRQLRAYEAALRATERCDDVLLVLAAPSFSSRLDPDVVRWQLDYTEDPT